MLRILERKMPINWKALKLKLGPTYEQQVTDVIQTFEEASSEGEIATVEYMCKEIAKEIDRLETFIQDNDMDNRIVLFQKQCRRLRIVLQGKLRSPTKGTSGGSPRSDTRSPLQQDNQEKMTYYPGNDGAQYNNLLKSNLQSADELALLDAARVENTSGGVRMERGIPIPPRMAQSKKNKKPGTRQSIYGWETKVNKGIAFPHANASEYHLNEGDSFSFQIVINRRDYHQLMNRRRIKRLDAQVKLKKILNESKRQETAAAASRFGGVLTPDEDTDDLPFAFKRSPRRNSLSTGPYVEPSYKARQMYREFSKEKWVGDKHRGFRTF